MGFLFHLLSTLSVALATLTTRAHANGGPYVSVSTSSFNSSCAAVVKSISIPNVTVNLATFIPAGTNLTFPKADPSCNRPFQIVPVDLCRVNMNVTTSNMSGLVLEAWLPKNWTGRFLSTGNGGLSGCIQFEDLAYTANYGFATVGANNGHDGSSGKSFYHNDQIVADFAYRSIHVGVVVGKQISKLFYKEKHRKSYYLGCSTGGRQGFKSVQDYPYDFDGVVVGAPAIAFNSLNAWSNHFYSLTGKNTSATFIPSALWVLINQEILKQCDGLDGLVDGIIEDPDLCNFNASKMLCPAGVTTNCLTSAQVITVNRVFSPIYDAAGTLVYPRMQPGSELTARSVYYSGLPSPFTDYFTYAIFEDPTWDSFTLTPTNISFALAKNPSNIETWKGDLSSFRNKGGKILHYHGMQDPIISSDNSERYYKYVSKTMGLSSHQLDYFYRYFRIAGMGHCSGGPGAWKIGQTTAGLSVQTAEDNVLMRLVAWVEKGAAPETVRGTKYVNDTVALGPAFMRKHCKYPTRNAYSGKGDPTKETSWNCVA